MNKYKPWEAEGISETQYYHARYLEGRQEICRLNEICLDAKKWLLLAADLSFKNYENSNDKNFVEIQDFCLAAKAVSYVDES